jgi:hypothetical protein
MKKNLFTFTGTCIIAGILLSSCSITKRHYTNGYYVSHHSGKQIEAKTQEQTVQKKTKPSLYTLQSTTEGANLDYTNKQSPITENGAITASNKQVVSKPQFIQNTKHHANYITTAIPLQTKTSLSHTKKIATETVAGDVLSLFWIVILILVILWLVALLTGGWGLGGFIYLLLVIALILLILWLLRII